MSTCKKIRRNRTYTENVELLEVQDKWSSNKFSFSVCVLYLLFLLQPRILCLCSIYHDPLRGSHSMSMFYFSWSLYPDPLACSHSLSVFHISWSSYKFSFSVSVLYLLILLQDLILILCLCSISPDHLTCPHSLSLFYRGSGYIEHTQRIRICKRIRRYRT
jgi:hypothetical protein